MKNKRILLALVLFVAMLPLAACSATAEKTDVNIAVLKGPTGMGAAALIEWDENDKTVNDYDFTIAGAPDALIAQLVTGELDMAALPTNTIAMLYQKTQGQVQALAVNTLGVLYVLERGDSVATVADLAGKTLVGAGQGTTVEAVAGALFGDGVTVDYVSEHAEAVAQAVTGKYDLVLLPEPFVTALLSQDVGFRVALDLTAAWEEASGIVLPMGGIAVRAAFAEEHPDAVDAFLAEYAASVAFAKDNPAEAAALIERHEILKADVAESAIPRANLVCLTGADMKAALEAFYGVLLTDNEALIGGAQPGADFYYNAP